MEDLTHDSLAARLADKYISRGGAASPLRHLELRAIPYDVERGLESRSSRATKEAARIAFAKLRAIVSEDYRL